MAAGERPVPVRGRAAPGNAECSIFASQLDAWLNGDLEPAPRHAMRAHIERCADCNQDYRAMLVATARLHREARLDVARTDAESAPTMVHRMVSWSTLFGGKPATPPHRLLARVMLFVGALLATLAWRSSEAVEGTATLTVLSGVAHIGGVEALRPSDPSRSMARGEWCGTGEASSAELSLGDATVHLDPDTLVWIEGVNNPRLRLERGRLSIEGECCLTSPYGVVEVTGGSAWVAVSGGVLSVDSGTGEVRTHDAFGSRALEAGQHAELALAR